MINEGPQKLMFTTSPCSPQDRCDKTPMLGPLNTPQLQPPDPSGSVAGRSGMGSGGLEGLL